jgi:O-acetyl-ADP-ribose deacetylase (regulator of RNase III)
MIEFRSGDLFETKADIKINAVNCVGAMGAGVALEFKKRYPKMFEYYRRACARKEIKPGKLQVWTSLDGTRVINFPTKRDWKDFSRYEDITKGLKTLREYLESEDNITVAMPALGCKNGGLNWTVVKGMIEKELKDLNAHIIVFEPQ